MLFTDSTGNCEAGLNSKMFYVQPPRLSRDRRIKIYDVTYFNRFRFMKMTRLGFELLTAKEGFIDTLFQE